MAKPISFAHVVFQTRKMDEMIQWYQTVLDFDVRFQHPVMTFLSFDEEHHRIALVNLNALDPKQEILVSAKAGSLEHVAYTYGSVKGLVENYVRLKALNIEPYWCINHGMTLSMYYGDPDGNQVECQVEVYETAEEANEFLMSDAFAKNPIGVEFDPAELVSRHEQGVSDEELLRYVEGPMMPPRFDPNR